MAENKDKKKNFHSVVSGYIDYIPKDYNAFVNALKSDPALADRLYSDLVKLEAQGYVNSVPVPDDIRTIFTGTTTTPTTTTETDVVAEEETQQQGTPARAFPSPEQLRQPVTNQPLPSVGMPPTNQPQPVPEETQIAPIDQQSGQVQGGRPISGDVLANAPKQEFQWSGQAPTKPVVQPQTGMPQTREEGMQQGGINPVDLGVSTLGSFETSLISGIGSELKGISELGYSLDKKIVGALEGTPLEGQYAMLSKPEDSWIYQAGQGLQNFAEENLYRNPEYQGGVADIVGQGLGSIAAISATGGLNPAGGVMKLGTKAMTNPQLIAYGAKQLFSRPSISGALMMVGQETDEARKLHRYANSVPKDEYVFNRVALGESEEDASKAYDKLKSVSEDEVASGMIPFALFSGATEAIPMERLFTRLGKASKDIVISAFKNGGIQGTEEAIQEMIQQTISNVGKGQVYNEAQRLSEGLVESAEGGGATGFVLGSILTALAGKRANIAKAVADGTMTKEEAIAELNDVNKAQTLVNDKLQALDNIVNSVANEDVKKLTDLPESKTFFDKNEASLTNPITTMPTQVEAIMDKIDGGILISAESLHEAYQWTNNAVKETLANQTLTLAEKGATLNILNGMLSDIDSANKTGQDFVEQVEEVSVQDRLPAVREGVKPLPQGQAPKGTATPSISQAKAIREENRRKQAGTTTLPSSGQTIVTPAPATTEVATEAVTETPTGTTAEAEVKLAELPTKTIEAEVVSETPVAGAEANPALADVESTAKATDLDSKAEINNFVSVGELDSSYVIKPISKDNPMYKLGYRYEARFDFPESLGENGIYSDGNYYKEIPTKREVISDITKTLNYELEQLNSQEYLSGRDEAIKQKLEEVNAKQKQLLTPTQDAVQKQTAGQVPVQSGTTSSQEVAKGEPQAEPQSTADKGQAQETGKEEVGATPTAEVDTEQAPAKKTLSEEFGISADDVNNLVEQKRKTFEGYSVEMALQELGVPQDKIVDALPVYVAEMLEVTLPTKSPTKKQKISEDLIPEGEIKIQPIPSKGKGKPAKTTEEKIDLVSDATDNKSDRDYAKVVHKNADNKEVVATDAHVMIVVKDDSITETESVDVKTGQKADVRYPDYKSVIPDTAKRKDKKKVNAKTIYNLASGIAKATKMFTGRIIPARIVIGDTEVFLNAEQLKRGLEPFVRSGITDIEISVDGPNRAVVFKGGDITSIVMPVQHKGENAGYTTIISEKQATPTTKQQAAAQTKPTAETVATTTEATGQEGGADVTETTTEEGNKETDFGKVISASSRFKPYETVVFEKPIIGKNGNKLISYQWAYEWAMLPSGKDTELKSKRISDWTQAESSAETGRDIVHKFTVERKDGTVVTVSSETIPSLLGYVDAKEMKNLPSIVSSVKTLAKQKMQLAILKAQESEYKSIEKEVKELPKPNIVPAEISDLPKITQSIALRDPSFLDNKKYWKTDGETTVVYSQDGKSNTPDRLTKEQLIGLWESAEIEKRGGVKPKGLYDLERRVERQEKKVEQATGSKIKTNEATAQTTPTTETTATTPPTLTPVNATDVETITKIENATEKGRELALAKPVNKWVKRAFDTYEDISSRAKKAGIYDGKTLKIGGQEIELDTPAKFKAFLAQSQNNFDAINEAVKGVESFSSVTDNIMGKFSNIENQAKQNESKTDKQVDNDITLQSGVNPKQILSGFGAVMKGLGFGDKAVSKITTAVEDWTAKAARKAMRSRYAFVGKTANIAQGFIRNIARTDKEITQRRKALGTVKSSPLVAMDFYNNAVGIVGNNPQALQRVHQVLDPEAYEGEVTVNGLPRVTEADLTPQEKQLYDILRFTLDYIHDWHYNNGFIKKETYDKYKGTYSPRFWEDTNMIDESPELAVMFQQMGKSLDRSYIKQRKDIDNIQSDIVEDPVYGTAIRMAQTLRNQALLDYASQVSTTKAVWNGTGNPPPGFVLLEGPKFGALNGKYVARDVAEDFKGYYMSDALMNEAYRLFRIYDNTGVRQFVKQSKTVFNPITVIGNALSGISFAFGAGVDPANLSANIPAARKSVQNKDADYKYLVQQGILGTDVFTGDIKTKSESVRKPTSPTQKSLKEKLFDTMDMVRDFYGATDDVTKLAVFKALLEQGKTREQAAKIVYESTQNYNEVGRAYDFASKMPIVGNPYIKFKADLARIVKNGLTKRPLTTSAYIGALYAFAAMASKLSDEDEETRKAREARSFIPKIPMPDFMKKIGLSDVPLVWQTKYGELNAARLFSPMYVYDTGEQGFMGNLAEITSYLPIQAKATEEEQKDFPFQIQFNDPLLGPLAQLAFYGTDFRGKQILDPTRTRFKEGIASPTDKLLNASNYLANSWIPFYDKGYGVVQAVKGEEDYYGRVRNWKQALVSMVVKVQDMSKPEVIKSLTKDIDYKVSRIENIEKEQRNIFNQNGLGSTPTKEIEKVQSNDKFSEEVKKKKIDETLEDAFAKFAELEERKAKIVSSTLEQVATRQKITAPTRR